MILRYTPQALAELDQILADISVQSPQGAQRVQARIQAVIRLLMQFPKSGQVTSNGFMRRVVATPYPYLIFYHDTDEDILIVGIRQSARKHII